MPGCNRALSSLEGQHHDETNETDHSRHRFGPRPVGLLSPTPPRPWANASATGAIVGGLLGGFLGAGGQRRQPAAGGALIGATAGAIAGGAIGATASTGKARDLRGSLDNDDIRIQNTGEELIVTMPEGILFDIDSAAIRASLQIRPPGAGAQPAAVSEHDRRRDRTHRQHGIGLVITRTPLGTARPGSGRRASLEEGVAPARVRAFGRGETEPVATNLTPEGRQAEPPRRGDHPSQKLIVRTASDWTDPAPWS